MTTATRTFSGAVVWLPRPPTDTKGAAMPFQFRLELANGEPADPPTFTSSEPNWRQGDRLFVNPTLCYVVVSTREGGVLVVERE